MRNAKSIESMFQFTTTDQLARLILSAHLAKVLVQSLSAT
jgi:hypothetical protein